VPKASGGRSSGTLGREICFPIPHAHYESGDLAGGSGFRAVSGSRSSLRIAHFEDQACIWNSLFPLGSMVHPFLPLYSWLSCMAIRRRENLGFLL
jgi:hypothetical protein